MKLVTLFSSILQVFCQCVSVSSVPEFNFPNEDIDKYFSSLDSKDPPLHVCTGISDGILYRIPPFKSCELPRHPNHTTAAEITIWWEDIEQQKLKGQECYATRSNVTCFYGLLEGCDYTYSITEKVELSIKDCKEIVAMKSKGGKKLQLIREGFWSTEDYSVPEGSFWYPQKLTRINYYVKTIVLTVNSADNNIMSLTGTVEPCAATKGLCKTTDGWLLWEVGSIRKCNVKRGQTTVCLKTEDVLSCPDVEMSLTISKPTYLCGKLVSMSKEGVMFTSDEDLNNYSRKVLTTTAAEKYFTEHYQAQRNRRSISLVTEAELDAKFHYLYDVAKEARVSEIQTIHLSLCKATQAIIRAVRYAAENGDPNMMVGTVFFHGKRKARLHGDVVALWKCQEIREYRLGDRGDNCTAEWPVVYAYQHHVYNGWMRPISHEIVSQPTPVPCPPPSFYFDIGVESILLTNRTFKQNLPFLPSLEVGKQVTEKEPSFALNRGVYSPDEVSQLTISFEMQRNLAENNRLENIINKRMQGKQLTTDENETFGKFLESMWNHLTENFLWLKIIFYVFICFLSVLLIGYTIYAFRWFTRCCNCGNKRKRKSGVLYASADMNVKSVRPTAPSKIEDHYSAPELPPRNKSRF